MNGIPVSRGRILQNAPTWRPRWPVFRGLFLRIFDLIFYQTYHHLSLLLPSPTQTLQTHIVFFAHLYFITTLLYSISTINWVWSISLTLHHHQLNTTNMHTRATVNIILIRIVSR